MTESALNVSRETHARLEILATLVAKWSRRINLVAPSQLSCLWQRHIQDSRQLFDMAPHELSHWVDVGSGGGFPGLVVAALAADQAPAADVTLIECDKRKATFLRTAADAMGLAPTIHASRAETVQPQCADVLSARAVASLENLCNHADRHLAPAGIALFPKGSNHDAEVDKARRNWQFTLERQPSQTSPQAAILRVGGLKRV